MNDDIKNEMRKDLPEGEGTPISIETASSPPEVDQANFETIESMFLGIDPASDATPEETEELPGNPDDWTPEQRKRVEEIMATLTPPEPEPEVNLKEHFKAGTTFRDSNGIRMVVRTVGKEAINISVFGQNGRFVDGHGVTLNGFLFVTHRSNKRNTTLLLRGIQKQVEIGDTDGEAKGK